MKKILLCLFLLSLNFFSQAQEIERSKVLTLLKTNQAAIGLSAEDIENMIISNAFFNKSSGVELIYLQQSFKGIPVLNQLQIIAFRGGRVVSNSGGRIKSIAAKVNTNSNIPAVSPETAVRTSATAKSLSLTQPLSATTSGTKVEFGKANIARENITATLLWVPGEDGIVRLAWQVYLVPKTTPDYFLIRVDAIDNKIISETNLTEYCNWSEPQNKGSHAHSEVCLTENNKLNNAPVSTESLTGPTIINGATYRVVPFPAESPLHPGGAHALRTDPWNAAPGNATTLKWHSNGTTDYNITRGNNVWAQEDLNANNGTGFSPMSTTPDPLTFNFVPDFTITPTQVTPIQNHQFAITNLFYWNNIIHDIVYQYGFDEVSGNFQANNLGRGGLGNDFVFADAQDGDFVPPNQNNANFATPPDGSSPRMQMYLFDTITRVQVLTPSSIAGGYDAREGNMSPANMLLNVGPVTAQVVYYNDNSGGLHEACVPPSNSLTGKIALIHRGVCAFALKVKNAQDAGAVGVIVINNVPGALLIMSGSDPTITIPAVIVSDITGAILIAQLGNNLTATLSAGVNRDGDLDNGVIVHEYAHGISNRLTGGPAQAGCLGNAEQMGEGWSDYYGLMLTQDWANSNVNTGFTTQRSIGTYASGEGPGGAGFRTQRYSTNFTVNNLVFSANLPGQGLQHSRGEIWCATLWDMTWNIIQQVNSITPNIYNANGNGGNVIALKLVTEAMKLQPCSPGFIDGRDAILQADQILYGGVHSCAIKEAFRRRGMGPLASQGSSSNVTDQVPDFSAAISLNSTVSVSQVPEGQNITYTNTVTTCSPVTNYLITDTLPTNVTYVSGGTYNAATRVVSFNVNLATAQTQTYSFTVSVNAGSYFPTVTLLDEPIATATMPTTLFQTTNTSTPWIVTNLQSHSAPYSVFSENVATPSEQILTTTNSFPLGSTATQLSFWHLYNTEAGYDGGVVEISTDGGSTWLGLGDKMYLNKYNGVIDPTAGTSISGQPAFTGVSSGFIKTSVNLASLTGQSGQFRWKFVSDNGTAGVGWYVDDIQLKSEPLVIMRSNLFSNTGIRITYDDTSTIILQSAVCTNVAITTQPANATACVGANATFVVVASGTNPTYQWQVSTDGGTNFTNITGATAATLTLNSVTATMANYRYRVVVGNTCPSTVTSSAAILTVSAPAVITAQPANTTVCTGTNATFTVAATGNNITYQWQVSTDGGTNFTNIAGATSATLTLTSVTSGQNNNVYRAVVTGCAPTGVNSANAILTVTTGTAITTQPANANGCTSGNATFTVVAAGAGLAYQWQISTDGGATWNNIAGQTTASLTISNITTAMNNNMFRVIVTGSCGAAVNSTSATLTVSSSALITTQPVNSTVCTGATATFVAVATGSSYQWQVSTDGGATFLNIAGATSLTLTLPSVTAAMNNNQYRLAVTSCSATTLNSNAATLTVNNSASISTQPSSVSVCTGGNASFTVTASGTALTYQWQISVDGGTTFTNITGATSASLALTNVTSASNNNRYRVIVGNACPTGVTSSAATLTVSNASTISTQPVNSSTCAGNNATFTVASSGTGQTYQWQVSTDGGTTFTNLNGETASSLTLNSVTSAMNNNRYRVNVTGCGSVTSSVATLTVNASPVLTISASPSVRILSGGSTTLTATSGQQINSYAWFLNGNLIAGSTGSSIVVTSSNLGLYTVRGTDGSGCFSLSNQLTISDSTISTAFIYPNPNRGSFFVQYNSTVNSTLSRVITVYDDKGSRVYTKIHVVTQPGERMAVNLNQLPSGTYMLQLSDAAGKKLAKGKVMID